MLTVLFKKDVKIFEYLLGGLFFLVLFFPLVSSAAFTKQINYQGKLTNAAGSAVADGNYSIEFKLYAASSGGSALWTETQTVAVTNGLFSIMLGSVTSLDSFDFNRPLYLTLNVQGDGEMTPRKVLGSVPNSFNAEKFDGLATTSFAVLNQNNIFSGLNTFSATTTLATTTFFSFNPFTVSQTGGLTLIGTDLGDLSVKNGLSLLGYNDDLPELTMSNSNLSSAYYVNDFEAVSTSTAFYYLDTNTNNYTSGTFDFYGNLRILENYRLSVGGTSTFTGTSTFNNYVNVASTLDVSGGDPVIVGGEGLSIPYGDGGCGQGMKIVGNYLYMDICSSTSTNQFRIIDISDVSNPKIIGGESLSLPIRSRGLDVVGKYAYIGTDLNEFRIIDISSPTNPVVVGGSSLTFSNAIRSVKVVGKYAYLSIYDLNGINDQSLVILDVSDPYNPKKISPSTINGLISEVRSLDVVDKYVYMVSFWDDDLPGRTSTNVLRIVDISDPTNPVVVGGSSLTLPKYARQIKVVGRYAYVAFDAFGTIDGIDNGLTSDMYFRIIDISDPTNPVVVGGENVPFTAPTAYYSGGLRSIYIDSNLAYVTDSTGNLLSIIDVSDATNPTIRNSLPFMNEIALVWPVIVSGNYAYVAGNELTGDSGALRIIDLKGLKTGTANIGSLKIGSLDATSDLITSGNLYANGLNINSGGIMTSGVLSVNSTTTPSFFGGSVGIGTTSPISKLSVVGTTTLSVGNTYWQTSKLFVNGVGDIPLLLAHGASTTNPATTYDFGAIKNNLYLVNNNGADEATLSFLQVDSVGEVVSGGNLAFDFGSSYFTVNTDFNPAENNSFDLGSPSLSWRNIYASTSISLGSLSSNGPVYSNNGALTNVNPSSRGYKDNILDASLNIDGLLGLQVKSFDWKTNGQSDFGLIAEEVRDVLPELYVDDGVTRGYRSGQLPFYLLQIAQRQEKKIAELDTRIASGTIAVATSSTEALNLRAIQSITGNWSISEDGTLVAKNIKAENATIENGVSIRDRATGNYSCIYIENGLIKTSAGECPTGNLVNPPTIPSGGTTASTGEVVDDLVASSSTDSGEVSTTTPSSTETTPGEAESTPPTIVESTPPVIVPEEVTLPVE